MENIHNSAIHSLPPKILTAVASHLGDDKSLVFATHVCHFWRSTLISSPRLWSRLTFRNARRALVFLERSGSAPVSVDIRRKCELLVTESLKRITRRLMTLRAVDVSFLDELLIEPLPTLRNLDIVTSEGFPSIMTLATTTPCHPLFHAPNLTNFRFRLRPPQRFVETPEVEDRLLNFLQHCPMLEVVFLGYDDTHTGSGSITNKASTRVVSLPHLRSFTHESPADTIHTTLFNRLSLPPTCDIAFAVTDLLLSNDPWDRTFPALFHLSYLSDVKVVRIIFVPQCEGSRMVKVVLIDSRNIKVSFNRLPPPAHCAYTLSVINKFLEFLASSQLARSVETLYFERCQSTLPRDYRSLNLAGSLLKLKNLKTIAFQRCNSALFLKGPSPPGTWCPCVKNLEVSLPLRAPWEGTESDVLELVRDIADSRMKCGNPLTTVTLSCQRAEKLLETCGGLIERLRSCAEVKLVEVASSV